MIVKDASELKRARRRSKFTQVDLARLVVVTQQYISALERGADKDCSKNVAERISKYLGVDVENLFEERQASRAAEVATSSRVARSAA